MSGLRASDADRDRVAEQLRTAAAHGRISSVELEERLERAFTARTEGELASLVADLPVEADPAPPRRRRPPGIPQPSPFVAVSLLLIGIWALTGAGYFWPIWPILGWGLFAVGPCARSCGGPQRRDTLRA